MNMSSPKVQDLPEPKPSCSRNVDFENSFKKDSLARLVEKQIEEIDSITNKIELWTKYEKDYKELDKLIIKMQDRVMHQHRIPIAGSQLAFVDGHIIHTNEFHVLLGDNYFALRSARQSTHIIDRRLREVQQNLKKAKEAKRKTEDWLKATEEQRREKEEFVEIIETM